MHLPMKKTREENNVSSSYIDTMCGGKLMPNMVQMITYACFI